MVERIGNLINQDKRIALPEIDRSYAEEITLMDFGDAFSVDNKFVLAYKNFWIPNLGKGHKILIARERTVPIKHEDAGNYMYPYRNEDMLRGKFGVVILPIQKPNEGLYVSEQYKVIVDDCYFDEGRWNADITIESPNPINADFIDGNLDFNEYLEKLNFSRLKV